MTVSSSSYRALVVLGRTAIALGGVPIAATAQARVTKAQAEPAAADSAAVAQVVHRFHESLAAGDSAAALALLAPDVVVLESGGVETRDDYRAHHLPADIEFARAVPGTRAPLRVRVRGDVAWTAGTSETTGTFRGRAVNSVGAESMVLVRGAEGWRIAAIHWSSRTRRP